MSASSDHSEQDVNTLRIRERLRQAAQDRGSGEGGGWDCPIATNAELKWRHQHWWDRREKVKSYLAQGWLGGRIYERFSNCGAMAQVQWSDTAKRHRVTAILCKTRHCEPCMRQKAGRIAHNLKEKLRTCPPGSFRFITLTLRHDPLTRLDEQLGRLIKCFRALRSKQIWKRSQRGGAFTLEVKHSHTGWHAHLHVISEGSWCDAGMLRDEWNKVTGDSFQADIRRIPDADALAGYVVKYITKSTSPEVWDNDCFAKEYMLAVKGTRTCATLGSWRGLKLTTPSNTIDDWQHVATLHAVVADARSGKPWAEAIMLSLRPPAENTADSSSPASSRRRRPAHN